MNGLHVITGPMFASKSTELITQLNRHRLANRPVLAFMPAQDTRSGDAITSHDGLTTYALSVTRSTVEILPHLIGEQAERPAVLAFDEVQFLPITYVDAIVELAREYRVVCAGLDLDAFEQPFETTMRLMAHAEIVEKRKAVCTSCGNDASRTQRFVDGLPATAGERIVVGGKDTYEARCVACFITSATPALA